jgi:diketogulonate reductase-like aldo/keto reductase
METHLTSLSIKSTVDLNNKVQIPILGLGVYQTPPGGATRNAVKFALKAGY